jgi:transposase
MSYKSKVVFKNYSPNQVMLFPPSLDELIPENHPVRVINTVIDKLNIEPLLEKYKGGGSSSYHPRMMLKIIIYGYLSNVYSSRKIEAAVKENIHFMWLSGMEKPDHNTINRFRSDRLKGVVKEVFSQVVMMLVESGHVDLQRVFTDGTKIEANANKYTFVWGKAIKRNKLRIKEQLEDLWKYAESVAKEELKDSAPIDFQELSSEKIEETIEKINHALKDKAVDKRTKQKLNYAKKNWPKNIKKYQQQEGLLGERNSFSKTDPHATFMRMKEDHMKNGQLKAAYNLQITTQNQFILNYSLHSNPTDTKTLIPHLQQFKKLYNQLPKEITADAGYGSEQNYEFLEKEDIEAYVKYNYFHLEQKKGKHAKNEFHQDYLHYNAEKNCYYCPIGQQMDHKKTLKTRSEAGYEKTVDVYQAQNCKGCPLRSRCHKSNYNRRIEVNHRLNKLKAQAKNRLLSEKGLENRSQRPVDVEAVFGNLKQNKGFKRFMLRGLEKVEIEAGLLAIAMNLKKVA